MASLKQKNLIVFDLNNVLCYREYNKKNPDFKPKESIKLPYFDIWPYPNELSDKLFYKLLNQNYDIAIWTSAQHKNAINTLNVIFPEELIELFAFVWSQDDCDKIEGMKDPTKPNKDFFVKDLQKIREKYPNTWNNIMIVDNDINKMIPNDKKDVILIRPWFPEESIPYNEKEIEKKLGLFIEAHEKGYKTVDDYMDLFHYIIESNEDN